MDGVVNKCQGSLPATGWDAGDKKPKAPGLMWREGPDCEYIYISENLDNKRVKRQTKAFFRDGGFIII